MKNNLFYHALTTSLHVLADGSRRPILAIHDVPREVFNRLPGKPVKAAAALWYKEIVGPQATITFFTREARVPVPCRPTDEEQATEYERLIRQDERRARQGRNLNTGRLE